MKYFLHLLLVCLFYTNNLKGQYPHQLSFDSLEPTVLLKSLFTSSVVIKNKSGRLMAQWKPSFAGIFVEEKK
ncbi:MAG: hypothetical protein DYG98_15615 [Haliscomenobacteraceae bacterium CHB4]|nr:hypothetical protein [Haliscomenobacteraceae bacterium CHB4]